MKFCSFSEGTVSTASEPTLSGTCAGTYDLKKQEIKSPNFPNDYNVQENCTWKINSPANSTIKLTFLEFSLEVDSSCVYDSLRISNVSKHESTSAGVKLCGIIDKCEETNYTSNGNGLFLDFYSDVSIVSKGFHIKFEIIGEVKSK